MRSLIILEVEHDETTDDIDFIVASASIAARKVNGKGLNDWTVRVDVPECFRLDK